MSECDKYQEMMSQMLDGELEETARADLAEYLKTCRDCAALYAAFSGISETVAADLEEPPEGLSENIMSGLRRAQIQKNNSRRRSKHLKTILAAAACFGVVIAAAFAMKPLIESKTAVSYASTADASKEEDATEAAQPRAAQYEAEAQAEKPAAYAYSNEAAADESGDMAQDKASQEVNGLGTASAAGTCQKCYELSNAGDWETLSALLSGKDGSLEEDEIDSLPDYVLTVSGETEDFQVYLYVYQGVLYYTDPANGTLCLAGCSQEQLDSFLSSLK